MNPRATWERRGNFVLHVPWLGLQDGSKTGQRAKSFVEIQGWVTGRDWNEQRAFNEY